MTFEGKRVAVIGTGATGVQAITEIAKTAGSLTVFQRTPNFCAPLRNSPIDAETQRKIKATLSGNFRSAAARRGAASSIRPTSATPWTSARRSARLFTRNCTPSQALASGWATSATSWSSRQANATITDFISRKIRERVHDPAIAEKLIPRNHGFGTRRVPLESGYYEVYNQDNVTLVDIRETPIECITPAGIKTSDAEYAST